MISPMDHQDYKTFLRLHLQEHKSNRGYQASLARACGCQPSYLSQVITGKSHLTTDHVIEMAQFVGLSPLETEYLLCLLLLARASSQQLRKFTEEKMQTLRQQHTDLSFRIANLKKPKKGIENFYYSSWYWSAVHVATSVPQYQYPQALAARFSLPIAKINEILIKLEMHNLVRHENGRWIYNTGDSHLSRKSEMVELNHTHWRLRALKDVQVDTGDSLHYTSVVAMTKEDAKKIRELIVQSILGLRAISGPSDSEEVYCINMDLFMA